MGREARPDGSDDGASYNLLFVCTGNTCRSPMAAAIGRDAMHERGWAHVTVDSAGVAAGPGMRATEAARRIAAERGLDLDDHRSKPITAEMLDEADLVLVMTPSHKAALEAVAGTDKVALITDFAEDAETGRSVPDPFGGDDDTYRATFDALERMMDGVLDRLEPILAP